MQVNIKFDELALLVGVDAQNKSDKVTVLSRAIAIIRESADIIKVRCPARGCSPGIQEYLLCPVHLCCVCGVSGRGCGAVRGVCHVHQDLQDELSRQRLESLSAQRSPVTASRRIGGQDPPGADTVMLPGAAHLAAAACKPEGRYHHNGTSVVPPAAAPQIVNARHASLVALRTQLPAAGTANGAHLVLSGTLPAAVYTMQPVEPLGLLVLAAVPSPGLSSVSPLFAGLDGGSFLTPGSLMDSQRFFGTDADAEVAMSAELNTEM